MSISLSAYWEKILFIFVFTASSFILSTVTCPPALICTSKEYWERSIFSFSIWENIFSFNVVFNSAFAFALSISCAVAQILINPFSCSVRVSPSAIFIKRLPISLLLGVLPSCKYSFACSICSLLSCSA